MKVLAEIPAPPPDDPRAGALRGDALDAFDGVLSVLGGARTVLVTGSPEGTRAAAVGLAGAAAAAGTRTALLECEMAEPRFGQDLGLAVAPGLREYLGGEVDASRILQPLVLAGPGASRATEPLVCIVAGRPGPAGAQLLASDRFRHAIGRLRTVYDLVVVGGPCLRPDDGELECVAVHADAALACVERAEARGRAARRLKRSLGALPTDPAGVIAYRS